MNPPKDAVVDATFIDVQGERAVDAAFLARVASHARRALGVPTHAELAVTLVDAVRMAELKQQAFGIHAATDVLAFPIDDMNDPAPGPLVLGDIVICPDVAAGNARDLGCTPSEEIAHLLVHGLLHLLGRDHADAETERAMFTEERAVLAGLAVVVPQ